MEGERSNSGDMLEEELAELGLGRHLCCIYRNVEEQLSAMSLFMSLGVERNEKCLYLVDDRTKEEVVDYFKGRGFDVEEFVESGQFEFMTKSESYLRNGYFDPDRMIDLLKNARDEALKEGYEGLRATGEMTWFFSDMPGVERLMEYESKLNEFLPDSNAIALCQYNEGKFSPEVLVDVLRTHPRVLLYDDLHGNPYYMPPRIFKAQMNGEVTWEHYESMKEDIIQRTRLRRREKEAREKLEGEHRRLRTLFSNLPGMAYRCLNNRNWTMKFLSEGCKELTGYEPESLVGGEDISYGELILPEDRDYVWDEVQSALEEREPFEITYRIDAENGEVKWVWEKGRGIFAEDGELKFLEGFITDITDRKRMEEKLRDSSRQLDAIFNDPETFTGIIDTDGTLLEANESSLDFVDATRSEVEGEKFWNTPWWDHSSELQERLKSGIERARNGEIVRFEADHIGESGEKIIVDFSLRPVENEDDEIVSFIATGKNITERKKAEERFRKFFEEMGDVVFVESLESENFGEIIEANPAAEQQTGYSRDELIGMNILQDLVISEPEKIDQKQVNEKLKSGESVSFTRKHCWKDGKERWIEALLTPIEYEGKKASISVNRDITERKEAEERYRSIFEGLDEAVFVLEAGDDYGEILEMNPATEELFGYSRDELIGKDVFDLIAEGEEKLGEPDEERRHFVQRKVRKDGTVFWSEVTEVPFKYKGKETYLSICRDITDRKEAEEKIRELNRFRERIIQDADIWLNVLDNDANVRVWNKAAEEISGYTEEEVVGHDEIWEWLYPDEDYRREITEKVGDILQGEEIESYETTIQCKEGEEKVISWTSHPLRNGEGEIIGSIALGRDITEQKEAEERKEFLNTLLRQDLRSKYQTLSGYLQLLEDAELSDEHGEYLRKAVAAGRETDEVLKLARELEEIEEADWVAERDIVKVLDQVMEEISDLAERGNIEIEEKYPESVGKVSGDYSLNTLFSQILKTRMQTPGCDRIKIEAKERNGKILVKVEDNGGSLAQDIKNLFSGKTYRGVTAGAGGARYYIIGEIAEHNQAEIEAHDSEFGGAKFEVHLQKA